MELIPISGSTRFGGVIGSGLSHSLSPFIHNVSASLLGLDVVYLPFDLKNPPTPDFFHSLLDSNCFGFNVTLPYKEQVATLLTNGRTKTCNTLVNGVQNWEVSSTDADGFCEGLAKIHHKLDDFSAFICMGYGGAAKALIEKIQSTVPSAAIFVLERTPTQCALQNSRVTYLDFEPSTLQCLLTQYPGALIIQCTSAPLRGDNLERFCGAIQGLKGAFVDLVYGCPSALLEFAKVKGVPCQDGLDMLICQGLLSQKLWWGQAATFSDIKAAIMRRR